MEAGIIDYLKTKGLNEGNGSGNGGRNRYERDGKVSMSRVQQDLCIKSKDKGMFQD